MGYANVDTMLDAMDSTHLYEWIAFDKYEVEQEQRAMMQAKAEAKVESMKHQRGR